ncbi:MAG: ABC transporter ATP-binding protein [Clostridiales bacterium]|jgi:branched-chain amino acid transport system ATP-binding protein|nr:ABC transporter ATP-binding protein [Clostridiales bacterium]
MLLEVNDIGITFGGLRAVMGFNMGVDKDEIVGLIGPNGAGKTTVFNLLTGVYTPTEGKIIFDQKDITGKKTNVINNLGIARTFQNIRLFKSMSVIDNVKVAYNQNMKYNELQGVFKFGLYKKEEAELHEKALNLLDVFGLKGEAEENAGNLPYGKQRKLEIARALGTGPKLLLLDEPAAGMNPSETAELMEIIRLVKDKFRVSILLIEHDMSLVMNICERLYVLDYGSLIASGPPEEIKNNQDVISAYLGE